MPSRLRIAALLVLVVALVAPGAAPALAPLPAGPRLAVAVAHVYPDVATEVRTIGPDGAAQIRIAGGPDDAGPSPIYDTAPTWAPDGSSLAFFGPAGGAPGVFLLGADGSGLRRLKSFAAPGGPRTFVQEPPIFDPRGDLVGVVFKLLRGHLDRPVGRFDEEGPPVVALALWTFPTDGSKPHPLTAFRRDRIFVPYSFAPDGTLLAGVETRSGQEIATLDLHGGPIRTVLAHAQGFEEPTFSPDGSQIAYFHEKLGPDNSLEEPQIVESDLMVIPAAGGRPRLVTPVKGGARWPAWDPSGSRLSFTTLGGGGFAGAFKPRQGNSLIEVNADGTCLTRVLGTRRGTIFGSAWQPSADRGAGRIAC